MIRKKEPWMKLGAAVLADGKPGVITAREIVAFELVGSFKVKLRGNERSKKFSPEQVAEVKGKEVMA